ncbi:protease inhibitor I42 family protein [Thermodesulfobacteriota bacterium]
MRTKRPANSVTGLWPALGVCLLLVHLVGSPTVCEATDAGDPPPFKTVGLNKPFEISLQSNPSTGYKWEVSVDGKLLRLKEKTFKRDASKPKEMVGVGGITTFVFVPVKTGQTTIDFAYRRPWEKKPPLERVSHIVRIVP